MQQPGQFQQMHPDAKIKFDDIVSPEVIQQLVQDPLVAEQMMQHLPEGLKTKEELEESCRSPQLLQQMRALSHGLTVGTIDASQFGFQPEHPGVPGFCEALQKHVDSQPAKKARWKRTQEDGDVEKDGGVPDGARDHDAMDET
eukprot:TRINITY_DN8202_c1_g2_i1.p2 TRINITY_DN8202_c1_g2~~TRINITY_DN8202_c1_g2_i1.p2  ORF type:complete len:143 (-),score=17.67 TRINITY_DN8202_c1_g2_i1:211-639(-)